MNYIPGFSNYLETSVPRYAVGGEVTSTTPYDLSTFDPNAFTGLDLSGLGGLNNLSGLNFASNFGGGGMGGQYANDPNLQYITAPISNKGNPTSQSGNVFTMTPDQKVRLVDLNTNTVIFEGTGYDAAREATRLGQGITDSLGRKASYDIQTANPEGVYTTVANEKKNKSTLGTIADVAGTLLPLAMIPLTMGTSALVSGVPGIIALGAGLGGAGAALKGDNILKGAAMGGLSAAGGQLLGPALGAGGAFGTEVAPRLATAIGTGIGSTAGGLVTGQDLKSSLLGGVASGALSYLTPDIVEGLGIGQGPSTTTSTSGADSSAVYGGANADIVVNATPFTTPNINLGSYKTPEQKYLDDAANTEVSNPLTNTDYASGYDGDIINVTGSVPGAVTGGLNLAGLTANPVVNGVDQVTNEIVVSGTRPGAVTDNAVTGGLNLGDLTTNPTTNATDEIVVTGTRPDAVIDNAVTGGLNLGTPTTTAPVVNPNEIVVTGGGKIEPTSVTGGFTLSPDTVSDIDAKSEAERKAEEERKKLGLEEYLRLAGLLAGAVGGAGGGNQGQAGTYTRGGSGLNPIFSAQLPAAGGLGSVGVNRTARPMGDVDWLTYGERPELNFFDYAQSAAPANPAPITTQIPNNPAGPSMYVPDDMRFARGGALPAKRGGSSDRTEFAVNGPGTGRSDDIPAVLSDGEYVIDAETVALLGDGSSKAGAKKLDDLRVKIRKHKGKKLAKGRFSANAKRPEAYLSGGRI